MKRKLPDYRVRLFLAVDLANSTAFKSQKASTSWIRTFRSFYANFLKHYQAIYVEFCEEHEGCSKYNTSTHLPKLWKTVGDEAIFVNRVSSQFQVFAYVHAFDKALATYKEILTSKDETNELDVKGNGWIASFPTPNQTIKMSGAGNEDFEAEIPDEQHELEADDNPAVYEFLGPGIDAGFRIAKNSNPGFLTLSPMLAWILCRANTNRMFSQFKFDLEFRGVNSLKGVVAGEPYPIIGINTERNSRKRKIVLLQNEMLGVVKTDSEKLIEYLESYATEHSIDMPNLTAAESDSGFAIPPFYNDRFVPEWKKLDAELKAREENLKESAKHKKGKENHAEELDKLLKIIAESLLKGKS